MRERESERERERDERERERERIFVHSLFKFQETDHNVILSE